MPFFRFANSLTAARVLFRVEKLTCPLRIDMLSDSTRDRCPSEASAHWRSTLGSSETIRSDNRSALTSSNSEWFRRKCPPADVRRLHREHQSLENQAVIGV